MSGIQQLDIVATSPVEVQVRNDGKVLWVHHDGITVLRICQMPEIEVTDERTETVDAE